LLKETTDAFDGFLIFISDYKLDALPTHHAACQI